MLRLPANFLSAAFLVGSSFEVRLHPWEPQDLSARRNILRYRISAPLIAKVFSRLRQKSAKSGHSNGCHPQRYDKDLLSVVQSC